MALHDIHSTDSWSDRRGGSTTYYIKTTTKEGTTPDDDIRWVITGVAHSPWRTL